jgi:hypothetical protein
MTLHPVPGLFINATVRTVIPLNGRRQAPEAEMRAKGAGLPRDWESSKAQVQ